MVALLAAALLLYLGLTDEIGFPRSATFWVLAVLVLAGELQPIAVWHRGNVDGLTLTIAFTFALVLYAGASLPTLGVAVLASAVADTYRRRKWDRVVFNASQYALAFGGGGLVLLAFGYQPGALTDGHLSISELWPIIPAAMTAFSLNHVLVGTAVALHMGHRLRPVLRDGLGFQVFTTAVWLSMAPIIVIVASRSLLLIPFLLIPVAGVHRGAQNALDKEHQAAHDALTGLPNRLLFREHAGHAIGEAMGDRGPAVALIDLDRFKDVNDTLGHNAGDRLLVQVAERLVQTVGERATVARFGGDEYGILLPDVGDASAAVAAIEPVLDALSQSFIVDGFTLHVRASIGVALYPDHGRDVDALLQRADVAMYLAKENHGGVQIYTADRDQHSRRRLALISDLRQAIEDGQLFLHYQPKAELETGEIVGVEALVRWRHPKQGNVDPEEFVSLAERTGLIGPLTDHVLDMALEQCAMWHRAGFAISVAVNLSVHNVYDSGLPQRVTALLDRWGLHPECLEFEITESTLMANPTAATEALATLRGMGVKLAIDDFGTGYSSLTYLKQLPVHELKIDRSFVRNLATDDNDAIIVRSTIELARNLDLSVLAEGVEDAQAWEQLAALGCDRVQGFYLSRPLGAAELTAWLFSHVPGEERRVVRRPVAGRPRRPASPAAGVSGNLVPLFSPGAS
jgi:diguanylate cyclase (GGDEF)-like protein